MKPFHSSESRLRSEVPRWLIPALGISVFFATPMILAATPKSPEQDTLEIAKHLKPIPDDEWNRIAGDKASQKYEVAKGDTLWDVSKRLFGDPTYWPKIWALNNGKILNPHVIFPGRSVSFQPGTGTSLPGVTVAEAQAQGESPSTTLTDEGEGTHHIRSQEWKSLPPQAWESVQVVLPPEVDPLGFDSRSRVKTAGASGLDLPVMATTQKLQPFGLIFSGEKEANYISLQDLVYIHPEGDLHVGQIYSVTEMPDKLTNPATEREGWAYPLLGKVKIVQQREGAYVGLVISARHPIERGALLIPMEPKVPEMVPIPGPSSLEGVILLEPQTSTSTTSQHKIVFVDRGTDDGVTPGMIFRVYQKIDPNNAKRASRANTMISADIMVLQSSQKFSTGLVVTSYTYITEGASAVLLTDVSDLLKKHGPDFLRLEQGAGTPPDELDSLDNGVGLRENEKRELKQLEKWKGNPAPTPEATPPETPTPAPTTGEELPPPPSETAPAPTPAPTAPPTAPEPEEFKNIPPPPPETGALPPPPETPAAPPAPTAPAPSEPAVETPGGELPPPPPPPPAD